MIIPCGDFVLYFSCLEVGFGNRFGPNLLPFGQSGRLWTHFLLVWWTLRSKPGPLRLFRVEKGEVSGSPKWCILGPKLSKNVTKMSHSHSEHTFIIF